MEKVTKKGFSGHVTSEFLLKLPQYKIFDTNYCNKQAGCLGKTWLERKCSISLVMALELMKKPQSHDH